MPIPFAALAAALLPIVQQVASSVSAPVMKALKQYGPGLAKQGLGQSYNIMKSLNFGNVAKVLTLDFKANTKQAEMGFDQFASKLANKFLVSGLELSSLRASLDEINKQFSEAMQEQGLAFASENLALQNKVGSLFSVLKEGSVDAGAIMAANIRRSLGEVSKDLGSTTEDINSIMELVPVTSKRALDSLGMSMNDFSSKALRLQTNVRVGLGEDASEFLNKAMSGEANVQSMKNDKTGVGQLIYNRFGTLPFDALAPEQRTQIVARIVNDEDFQKQIEAMANKAGGFELVFRRMSNSLFDSHTGVFGVLREVTIEFENFTGETIQSTTSIFNEITELAKAIFDPKEGFFAAVLQAFNEALGLDGDSALKLIVRVLRFFRDSVGKLTELVKADPVQDFIKGLAGVFKVIASIGGMLWSMVSRGGLSQKQMDSLQGGIDKIIPAISDKILPFFTDFVNNVGDRIRDILKSIIYISSTVTFDGSGLLKAIGGLVNALLTQIGVIIPLALQATISVFQSLVKNFGGYANLKRGFLDFVRKLSETINIILDSLHAQVIDPMNQAVKSTEFADFFKELGTIIGPTVAKMLDTWVNFFLIQRESILLALINMLTPELKNSITKNMEKLIEFFVFFTNELFKVLLSTIIPTALAGIIQIAKSGIGAVQEWMSGGNSYQTITPPNFQLTPPGSNYTTNSNQQQQPIIPPLTPPSGTYTTKASGNFFQAVELERSMSSVFARPVIANSDEIIIPKGRIQELNTNIENKVVSALAPAFNSIAFEQKSDPDSGFKLYLVNILSRIESSLKPKPVQAVVKPISYKPIIKKVTEDQKPHYRLSSILTDIKQQTSTSTNKESNNTNVLNLIKETNKQATTTTTTNKESNNTNVLNLIKEIKNQATTTTTNKESNNTNVLNLIKEIKNQTTTTTTNKETNSVNIVSAIKDIKNQSFMEKISILNRIIPKEEPKKIEEELIDTNMSFNPVKDALQLSELSKTSKNSTTLVDHLANVIKVVGKIDENTKNTQRELVISNLLKARTPAAQPAQPAQLVNVQANIPPIEMSTPDIQNRIVETIKETVIKKQSESIFDKLFGLIGINKPKEPTLTIPKPLPQSAAGTPTSLDKPIQIVIQLDGRTITDVVLKEINSRVTQINSTP